MHGSARCARARRSLASARPWQVAASTGLSPRRAWSPWPPPLQGRAVQGGARRVLQGRAREAGGSTRKPMNQQRLRRAEYLSKQGKAWGGGAGFLRRGCSVLPAGGPLAEQGVWARKAEESPSGGWCAACGAKGRPHTIAVHGVQRSSGAGAEHCPVDLAAQCCGWSVDGRRGLGV